MLTAEVHQHHHHRDDHFTNWAGRVWAALAGILGVALVLGGVIFGTPGDPRGVSAIRCGALLVAIAGILSVALTRTSRRETPSAPVDVADLADLEEVMLGRLAAHERSCVEGLRGLRDEVAEARAQLR